MNYTIIVAKSLNNVIGVGNELPWKLSGDLKLFKKTTMGKSLIMGRNTFQSIGKALPGRKNYVLTRSKDYQDAEDLFFFSSFDEIESELIENHNEEAFIIGGGSIYKEFFHKASKLIITEVHTKIEGDVYFPEFDISSWKCVEFFDAPQDQQNDYPWSRKVFVKKR